MYCSECKLRVADDSAVACPVCQGPLQSDSESGESAKVIDFAEELDVVLNDDKGPDAVLADKLDAYVRDDANLDFDPQVLGLKSSETEDTAATEDDIRVLADLWEKEDIGADLDGVFADAFNLEEGASELVPDELAHDEPVAKKSETGASETQVMPAPAKSAPVISTPTPTSDSVEKSRNLGLPLLVFVVLLIAGGGWFYMQNTGAKSGNKLTREIKSPTPPKPQIKSRPESVVAGNEPAANKLTPAAENSVIAQPQPVADATAETSVENSSGSATGAEPQTATVAAVAPIKAEVAAAEPPAVSETPTPPAAEALVATSAKVVSPVPKDVVAAPANEKPVEKTLATPAAGLPPVEKVEPVPLPVKEKAVVEPKKVARAASSADVAATPRYVVHIGSFRNAAGAARQLAKLQKKGFSAYAVEVDLGAKGVWQRIFVPGGALKSDARKLQKQLAKIFPREESLIRKLKK